MAFSPSYGSLTDIEELGARVQAVIAEAKPFGFDIETGYDGETREKASLHPEENFLTGYSFTNSTAWARYVPLRHDTGINVDNKAAAEALWPLFHVRDAEGLPLGVAHGAKFELRCMSRWFHRHLWDHQEFGPAVRAARGYFPIRSCTLLESFTEAKNPSHGLKEVTFETFGYLQPELLSLFPLWEAKAAGKSGMVHREQNSIRFNVLDPGEPRVVDYACEDALWALANHLRRFPAVRRNRIYRLEMALLPVVCAMEDEGICYDWNLMRDVARKAREFGDLYQAEVMQEFSELAGEPVAINFASSKQFSDLLYNKCAMPVHRWTDGGKSGKRQPSVDAKTALPELAKQYVPVQKYLNWKGLNTLRNNYLETYEGKFTYAADSRAHPGLLQHGTITGRFSAEGPNYQQSPKKYHLQLRTGETFDFNFRDCIVAPPQDEDGFKWYLLGFDYGQIELRVLAGEAQEPGLLDAFAKGEDVHVKTAALMLGLDLSQVTDDHRQIGKTMNFALSYQMTEEGLADRLGITVEDATRLFAQYFATYPAVKAYMDRTVRRAREDGYVTTRFGRRVPLPEVFNIRRSIRREAERSAGNAPIQGSAADYVKISMVQAYRALREAGLSDRVRMVMCVHDALEFYVRGDVTPLEVIDVLQPAVVWKAFADWPDMEAAWHLGRSWGSVRELELLEHGAFRTLRPRPRKEEPARELAGQDPPAPKLGDHQLTEKELGTAGLKHLVREYGPEPEPDATPRRVLIVVPDMPGTEEARALLALLRATPGPNTAVLQTPDGAITIDGTCGLTPLHEAAVSVILGGASVMYDLDSVDTDALARGLEL